RFGYPGRIDADERVWLTFAGVEETAVVSLNGQPLGRLVGGGEFAVTSLLRQRNELLVEVEAASDRGGLCGEVALEARRTAYLKCVSAGWLEEGDVRRLEIRGAGVGTAERPLELYAILDRSNVAYGNVNPAPAGQPFLLVSDSVGPLSSDAPHVL